MTNYTRSRRALLSHLLSPAGVPSSHSVFRIATPPRVDLRVEKTGYGPRKNQPNPTTLAEAQGAYRLTLVNGTHDQILAAGNLVQDFRKKQKQG